ncbi:unnamed protein product [Acanthoscelides obtectus]|uniref:HTH psq-type domain-containing protein n=1 Tax=Acanthoscelides obtectus TaxID=200917 RepID=A0A9P0JXS0_ACAOB|nr:unnamed protein product [Acanthoscelides obtectus]CAK1623844.1 hypothetical protein AOBTE_LOCUS2212 [Acanthoscelides obtectus]
MERCLHDVTNHILTQREASEKYKIPRSTIKLKLKARRNSNVHVPGQEKSFVDNFVLLCDYGFPLTLFDLRCVVKMYLDSRGTTINAFKNNFPGRCWAEGFLERHKKNFLKDSAAILKEFVQP